MHIRCSESCGFEVPLILQNLFYLAMLLRATFQDITVLTPTTRTNILTFLHPSSLISVDGQPSFVLALTLLIGGYSVFVYQDSDMTKSWQSFVMSRIVCAWLYYTSFCVSLLILQAQIDPQQYIHFLHTSSQPPHVDIASFLCLIRVQEVLVSSVL